MAAFSSRSGSVATICATTVPTGSFSLTEITFCNGCTTIGALSFSSSTTTFTVAVLVSLGVPPSTAST